jgi:anti-anti-sigma factor
LGPTIGTIPFTIPTPKYAVFCATILFPKPFFGVPTDLIWLAMGIAIVSSLQSLLAAVSVDNLLKTSSNTRRELVGQGLGNIVSALFGGIVSAGSQSRAMANFSYGGRTANSRLFSGLFALAVLLFISPLLSKLPKVVLAATLIVLAFKIFDAWSFNMVALLATKKITLKQVFSDVSVVAIVTATLVFVGVFEAVGAGIFISILLFIFRMGKSVIRRTYDGKRIRSNFHRTLEEINCLEEHGHKIMVYELEGSLFFGTADKVAATIEEVAETDVDYIVLDLKRVSDIDSTGAQILIRMMEICQGKNKHLILSSIHSIRNSDALSTALSILQNRDQANGRYRNCYMETIDDALGWVEDRLLDRHFGKDRYDKRIPLGGIDVLGTFAEADLKVLATYLVEAVYRAGELILEQGKLGEQIYFIVQGKTRIIVDLPDGTTRHKIATLCPGTVFGEMAIIDRGLHSANVVAETDVTCLYLPQAELYRLNQEQPDLARQLLIGLARELSKRIRIANRITTELKG